MHQKLMNSQLPLCPTCNKAINIITDPESGEIICGNCGTVVTDKVQDNRAEWNSYDMSEVNTRSRIGAPTSLARHDRGLSTVIGKNNRDAGGQQIDVSMRTRIGRWRTWDFRTQNYRSVDRSLNQAFTKLDMIRDRLGLPDSVVEKTAYIYRKIQEKGLVRGRTIKGALAVAAYIACRDMEIPRTLREMAEIANVKEKETSKLYRKVVVELDLKVPMIDPKRNMVRIANKCGISEKTKRYAIKIMDTILTKGASAGKDPMGLAAAILYLSGKHYKERVNQMKISEAAGVTEVTLRHNLKDIVKIWNLENHPNN
jgi:transcription initiation factor TFIIB